MQSHTHPPITILMAEDDPDDRLLVSDAFSDAAVTCPLLFVEDGEELLDYLHRRGVFADSARYPTPGLILLDLNMPRKNGREALLEIKSDPLLRKIPVVVLSTSRADEDIERSYRDGVNSFITKPSSFSGFLDVVRTLSRYWLDVVELPTPPTTRDQR